MGIFETLLGGSKQQQPEAAVSVAPVPTLLSPTNSDRFNAVYPSTSLDDAEAELKMTPQERKLYQYHLDNMFGPGGVDNKDGSRSTVYSTTVEGPDGGTYVLPTVRNGKIISPKEAAMIADGEGWKNYPRYGSPAEADARYEMMHKFMERDSRRDYDEMQRHGDVINAADTQRRVGYDMLRKRSGQ